MSEVNLAASPAATVVAGFLISADPPPQCTVYHGVLTPTELDARPEEIAALISAIRCPRSGLAAPRRGPREDRFRWLSGMVTNTVNDLAANAGAWNLVLNAQGRIQGDLTVWREGDDAGARNRRRSGRQACSPILTASSSWTTWNWSRSSG